MNWETITAFISSIGLLELIKWAWTRNASKRKAGAEASQIEWELLHEQLVFFQEEVKDKTRHIRELTDELIATKAELALKRCDRQKCPNRLPPNGY